MKNRRFLRILFSAKKARAKGLGYYDRFSVA